MKNNKALIYLGIIVLLIILLSVYLFFIALGFIREKYIYIDTINLVSNTVLYTDTSGEIEYADGTKISLKPAKIKSVLNYVSNPKRRADISDDSYDAKISIDKSFVKIYLVDEDSANVYASFGDKNFNFYVYKNSLAFYLNQIKEKYKQ